MFGFNLAGDKPHADIQYPTASKLGINLRNDLWPYCGCGSFSAAIFILNNKQMVVFLSHFKTDSGIRSEDFIVFASSLSSEAFVHCCTEI